MVLILETSDRGVRAARPRLPSPRAVLLEHVRVTGHALRWGALLVVTLLAVLTVWVALQGTSRDMEININAWPTQLPGLMGALLPIVVWARDERFGPSYLWTLPVDRRRHAVTKVLAGWVWLMGGVALFVVWLFAITFATGGRVLPPATLYVLTSTIPSLGAIDPAALRSVRWVPGPMIWAVPFTSATATYLLVSALALGSRHPIRWVIGSFLAYAVSVFASEAGAQLGAGWPADSPRRAMGMLVEGRYGLDALLTARIETLGYTAILTTGEPVMVWREVPALADWRTAALLWTSAGLVALWAAASRHREVRRG